MTGRAVTLQKMYSEKYEINSLFAGLETKASKQSVSFIKIEMCEENFLRGMPRG